MAEVARKIIGDAPLAYVEGVGAVRVAEDDIVAIGKNDVSHPEILTISERPLTGSRTDTLIQGRTSLEYIEGTVGK